VAGVAEAMRASAVGSSPVSPAWAARAAVAVVVRPWLWGTAVRQVGRLAPSGWWRRSPHLPLPDPGYLHFRLVTAYGGDGREPTVADLVTYLHWCRAWPRVIGD